jgi:transcriptional regulator with XRE-family HTH domain
MIGDRLRNIRQQKKLSQREVEERTGLLRCYISRVENGHTAPSIGTLEKMARALELPMYRLFYDGEKPPNLPISLEKRSREAEWGSRGKNARFLHRFRKLLAKMDERNRRLLLAFAIKVIPRRRVR